MAPLASRAEIIAPGDPEAGDSIPPENANLNTKTPLPPAEPCGIPKLNIAAVFVPAFETVAVSPADNVVTVPIAIVAAVPSPPAGPGGPGTVDAAPVGPCGPVTPLDPVDPFGPATVDAAPVGPCGPVGPTAPSVPGRPSLPEIP